MRQQLAAAMAELIKLEEQVSAAAAAANAKDQMRVYEWRPSGPPELPAIWNWIDEGTYEIVDTAQADDLVIITATIGVRPSDLGETMHRLVHLVDVFRAVVDPALDRSPLQGNPGPLGGTVREAKRIITRSHIEDFNGIPVMCMAMLLRLRLRATVR